MARALAPEQKTIMKQIRPISALKHTLLRSMDSTLRMRTLLSPREWKRLSPGAVPCWWVLVRTKQLSVAATAGVLGLCVCARYCPVGSVCSGAPVCFSAEIGIVTKQILKQGYWRRHCQQSLDCGWSNMFSALWWQLSHRTLYFFRGLSGDHS